MLWDGQGRNAKANKWTFLSLSVEIIQKLDLDFPIPGDILHYPLAYLSPEVIYLSIHNFHWSTSRELGRCHPQEIVLHLGTASSRSDKLWYLVKNPSCSGKWLGLCIIFQLYILTESSMPAICSFQSLITARKIPTLTPKLTGFPY